MDDTATYFSAYNSIINLFIIPAMKNGRCNWPRGKVIGGSSVLNYMLYVRGNKKDYDGWEAQGNPGWGYRDALYYFKKSEDNQNPYLAQTPYHGTGGYLTVSEAPYHTPLVASFIEGGKQLGYKNRDINGEYQTGEWLKKTHIYRLLTKSHPFSGGMSTSDSNINNFV